VQFKFLHGTNIDFIGRRYVFFAISGILALVGIVSLIVRGGPNYGIDFTGGVLVQAAFSQQVNLDQVRATLEQAIGKVELQSSGSDVIIRAKKSDINQDEFKKKIEEALSAKFPQNQVTIQRTEYVGPAVGKHLGKQAFYAVLFSFLGIVVYVAFRFKSSIWGAAGIFGIMHDVFVVFGIFALFNREITLTAIAAFLTIAGYSINDTIVVFDRMRENLRLMAKQDIGTVINKSINQTLSRTLITVLTVFFVVLALFFVGGEGIHDFAFAMLFGTIIGCYSSIYVCAPIVYEWTLFQKKRTAAMMGKSKR
jgi:preprotein translocase subunit SecF